MFVNVAVIYSKKSKGFVGVLQRCKEEISNQGFELTFHLRDGNSKLPEADIALIDGYSASETVLKHYDTTLIAILEKADSASVFFRDLLKDPRVNMMLKVSKLHQANENYKNYRFEEYLCGGQDDPPDKIKVLSTQDLNKVKCGPNFFSYNALANWQNINDDLSKHRNIDVHCVVSTEKYPKYIKEKRKEAVKIVAGMHHLNTITGEGRPYANNVYREQIIDSKIVVAPFGNGYMSYRMAEAMLAGAVLICPDSEFAVAAGDPLRENVTYISCNYDYSDLKQTIHYVLDNWDGFYKLRKSSQKIARELWAAESVAKNMGQKLAQLYLHLKEPQK